jgi:hypothetical protein
MTSYNNSRFISQVVIYMVYTHLVTVFLTVGDGRPSSSPAALPKSKTKRRRRTTPYDNSRCPPLRTTLISACGLRVSIIQAMENIIK